jgi:ABC-type glycerol-3-phosphate transport system permease component
LHTSAWMDGSFACSSWAAFRTCDSSLTSTTTTVGSLSVNALISSRAALARSRLRHSMYTRAFLAAAYVATCFPNPELAPVTTTTLPDRSTPSAPSWPTLIDAVGWAGCS